MKNQYSGKIKNIKIPYYTADIKDGYIQNKVGNVFRGQGEILSFGPEYNSVYVLSNPKDSNINLFLRTLMYTNLSPTSMGVNVIYYGEVNGDLIKSCNVANGNTTYQNLKSISSIYSGSNVKINCGVTVCTYSIQGYSTYRAPINGSLLLAPGMNHIIEVFPINCNQLGYGVVGFDWWEEPIQNIVESDLSDSINS